MMIVKSLKKNEMCYRSYLSFDKCCPNGSWGFFVAFPQVLVVKTQLIFLKLTLSLSNGFKC